MKLPVTGKAFRANALTHPARAHHNGAEIVALVDHQGVGPAVCALTPDRPDPRDHVRYGVEFADGTWEWATPSEIVSQ